MDDVSRCVTCFRDWFDFHAQRLPALLAVVRKQSLCFLPLLLPFLFSSLPLPSMTEKEATVYIVDLGKSMNQKHNGRDETDLAWSMRYVWDKITTTVR